MRERKRKTMNIKEIVLAALIDTAAAVIFALIIIAAMKWLIPAELEYATNRIIEYVPGVKK